MKRTRHLRRLAATALCSTLFSILAGSPVLAKTEVLIGIGTQNTTTNTVTGGIVIKEMKLMEKHLPKTGKYAAPGQADAMHVWAFRGRPVYTFSGDKKPGDTQGDHR